MKKPICFPATREAAEELEARARREGLYFSASAARRTASAVLFAIRFEELSTRDTVEADTPATRATCCNVARVSMNNNFLLENILKCNEIFIN